MSTDIVINEFESTDSLSVNPTDFLDFLNSSDNEQEGLNDSFTDTQAGAISETASVNEDSPSLTLSTTNVVVMASMQCHLRLKEIARSSVNVEYKALQNHVIMRMRSPYTVATIWSSGKIWCTGANSLTKAKIGARRVARRIAKCGFPCRFSKYRVVNIMATCHLPFRVRLEELVKEKPRLMSYEPELSPGLTFKSHNLQSTLLKLFSTGRVVIMGPSLDSISALVEDLVPLAALHQTDEPVSDTDDEKDIEQQKTSIRTREALAARRMVVLPGELPMVDAFGYAVDDDVADEDNEDSDSNDPRDGDTTDDSTDSGASLDSGGISTRQKRRKKSNLSSVTSNFYTDIYGSQLVNKQAPTVQSTSLQESSHPVIFKAVSNNGINVHGIVQPALKHDYGTGGNQTLISQHGSTTTSVDDSWCRRAVASGSTKRACVVTYSGTEDSDDTSISTQPKGMIVQATSQSVRSTAPFVTTAPSISSNCLSKAVTTVSTMPYSTMQQTQQYVIVTTAQRATPTVATPHSSIQLASPCVSGQSQPHVVRLTTNPILSHNGVMSTAVYPVRIPTTAIQPTTVIPPVGTKIVTLNSSTPNANVTNPVGVSCVTPTQTVQLVHPPAGNASLLVTGSTVYCPSQFQITTPTLVSGSPGLIVGHVPQTIVPLSFSPVQAISNLLPLTPTVQTYIGNPHTKPL